MVYEAACDRVKSVTDPQTGTISYTYATSGERLTMTAPNAEVTTYAYDNYTLLPSPTPDKMMRPLRTITDAQGRKVSIYYLGDITQGGPVYGPNILGLLDNLRFNQSFDANGNLLSYCENKMLYSATPPRALGTTTTKFYWRTNASSPWQNKIVGQNAYGYNVLTGQKTTNAITDSYGATRTETYNYDELSRLTGVAYGDGQTQGYSFDSMGNRLVKTDSVTGNETYSYNNANMLLTRNGQGYTNDVAGNTLTGGGRTMTWDSQNRMVSCVKGGVTSQFTYGTDGLRRYSLATNAAGEQTETKYVLDGQNVIQEIVRHRTNASSSWDSPTTVGYMMGGSGPAYRKVGTASPDVRWYCYDGGGNVLGEVDVLGNVTGSRKHDVYGLTRGVSGTVTSKHGWQGGVGHQSEDETGLIYMRARYYAPELGRFQTEDLRKDGSNWFSYCKNNPINNIDRTGEISIAIVLATVALLGMCGIVVSAEEFYSMVGPEQT